jgi:non-specific serine/threonine protein kinase
LIGQTLSHYRITAPLGAGAMGDVYRATDTKLGREVALKVLPAEMASSPERLERFQREAQALATLDHPGIVTVYSVEEADGVHFLTMQLVEGEPLDRLVVEGGLPVDRLLAIADSLAEALTAAHGRGIVHRDLKPANVMVTHDGRVKVLDFGLAKMTTPRPEAGSSELPTQLQTQEGAVMGTVPYMSPEQLRGRALDHRSDLFSFGVLLYEMSTGRRPFTGESSPELASAILRDSPTPPDELRPELPEALARVIWRSLEKSPDARYASAEQLLEALRQGAKDAKPGALQPGDRSAEPPRIAVLPFSNLSGDPEQEYFGDGMAEEILNALASLPGMRVAARSSAFSFKGKNVDVRTIGRQLEVNRVLEGSVRRAGSRLRINAQLVSAEDGYQLWSQVFDREMTDIFEIQEEIAQAIVVALRDELALPRETPSLVRHGTDDIEAYNSYLRGRYQLGTVDAGSVRQAIRDLEEAVAADPDFADAWAALSWAWSQLALWAPFGETAQGMRDAWHSTRNTRRR